MMSLEKYKRKLSKIVQ